MSVGIDIKVIGLEKLLAKFEVLPVKLKAELVKAATKSAIVVWTRAKKYPPQRPSARYHRTLTLGRKWEYKVYPDKASSRVFNGPPNGPLYAKWVMGANTQAWMHKGRWATVADIAHEQEQKVKGFYEEAIKDAIK